jgi:hypothetical protein
MVILEAAYCYTYRHIHPISIQLRNHSVHVSVAKFTQLAMLNEHSKSIYQEEWLPHPTWAWCDSGNPWSMWCNYSREVFQMVWTCRVPSQRIIIHNYSCTMSILLPFTISNISEECSVCVKKRFPPKVWKPSLFTPNLLRQPFYTWKTWSILEEGKLLLICARNGVPIAECAKGHIESNGCMGRWQWARSLLVGGIGDGSRWDSWVNSKILIRHRRGICNWIWPIATGWQEWVTEGESRGYCLCGLVFVMSLCLTEWLWLQLLADGKMDGSWWHIQGCIAFRLSFDS